jgi:hypothetical protein
MARSPSSNDDSSGLLARSRQGDNAEPLTISEISQSLKRTVEDRFGYVRLRGELSGVKRAASGHMYCTLKDDKAVLDGVMWRGNTGRLAFVPEDGLEVIATGKLTTYPGRSKYQIVMDSLEIAGEGALLALLEKTRARLEAEGLFARERKRRLPFLPRTIGVVTSPTGSVIRDILHRLADRFPSHVLVAARSRICGPLTRRLWFALSQNVPSRLSLQSDMKQTRRLPIMLLTSVLLRRPPPLKWRCRFGSILTQRLPTSRLANAARFIARWNWGASVWKRGSGACQRSKRCCNHRRKGSMTCLNACAEACGTGPDEDAKTLRGKRRVSIRACSPRRYRAVKTG